MYEPNYATFIPQGWECPRCHRVYSPSQPFCLYCNDKRITYRSTTAIPTWIYKEKDTTTGSIPSYDKYGSITVDDDIIRRNYYDDEDLWGKPL